MADLFCPLCADLVHRSHTRGLKEKLVKTITSYRPYRCSECGWRGWLHTRPISRGSTALRTIVIVLITLVLTILITLYLVDKFRTS